MDHERVNIRSTTMSCGVMELSRISSETDGVLYQIASRLYHPSRGDPCACFVFSDVVDETPTNSILLIKTIDKLKLGFVFHSDPIENPKTGNMICVFTWNVDHENFLKWYSDQRVKRMKKVGT